MIASRAVRASVFLCAVLVALASVGCGSDSPAGDSSSVLHGREGRPDVPVPDGPPPSKLVVVDLKKGSGTAAEKGSRLSVRYFRFAYEGHRILEDHWGERPISYALGGGETTPALERGLLGVKAGGRRELVLPSKMTSERTPEIYVAEALSVAPPERTAPAKPTERVTPTGPKPAIAADPGRAPSGLVVRELKKGRGGRLRRGELIGARFMSFNYVTKRVQDFWGQEGDVPAPYHFILGQGRVRKGWEMSIPGRRLGTRLELLLPSSFAYGEGAMRYVVEFTERQKVTPDRES